MKKTVCYTILITSLLVIYSCKKKSDPSPTVSNSYNDTSVTALKNSTWVGANQCGNDYPTHPCPLDTSFFSTVNYSISYMFYKFTNDSLFVSTTEGYNHYADTVLVERWLITDFFYNGYSKEFQETATVSTWGPKAFSLEMGKGTLNANIWWFVKRK